MKIEIELEEYKELLEIKGRYEQLKDTQPIVIYKNDYEQNPCETTKIWI